MSEFTVDRTGSGITVGATAPAPGLTGPVEGRGALLLWDWTAPQAHPSAVIGDPARAADWLWEIYGPEAAASILDGPDTVAVEWESPVLDAARDLALLQWAAAWWPASHAAAVPALPRALLRAETAWRTSCIEHLLDDDEAVERALARVDPAALAPFEAHPELGTETAGLAAKLDDLADAYGVEPHRDARSNPGEWALAAGGTAAEGPAIAGGTAAIDAEAVPRPLIDTEDEAAWTLKQGPDGLVLAVSAPAAPGAGDAVLTARLGAHTVPLRLDPETGAFTGEAAATFEAATRLGAEEPIRLHARWFAPEPPAPDPEGPRRRAAATAFARTRLAAPDATLTERAAARS